MNGNGKYIYILITFFSKSPNPIITHHTSIEKSVSCFAGYLQIYSTEDKMRCKGELSNQCYFYSDRWPRGEAWICLRPALVIFPAHLLMSLVITNLPALQLKRLKSLYSMVVIKDGQHSGNLGPWNSLAQQQRKSQGGSADWGLGWKDRERKRHKE